MTELFESKEVLLTLFSAALISFLGALELAFSAFYLGSFFTLRERKGFSRIMLLVLSLLFLLFALLVMSPLLLLYINKEPPRAEYMIQGLLALLLAQQTALGIFIFSSRASRPAIRSSFIVALIELTAIVIMGLFSSFFTITFFIGTFFLGIYILIYGLVVLKNKQKGGAILLFYSLAVMLSAVPYVLQLSLIIPISYESHLVILGGQMLLLACFFVFMILWNPPPIPEEPLLSDYVDKVSIALTRFIPKEFLQILEKPSVVDLRLGDHVKREMTIFFSDIRQFTNLSEDLTPEESFKFINSYLARIVPAITQHGGFVDKYMGDAIMALFPNEEGPDAAVRSAIDMQRIILEYNTHRAKCNYRPLSMGIGLHTGTLMLGVVGVEDRMQNTVISDAVNLASRLESITKVFNISIAISDETFKSLKDPGAYMYRFIGKVRVKGKEEPVSVFEIFDGLDPQLLERKMKANNFFEQGMMSYYRKDFTDAMYQFRKVLDIMPEDGAAIFYLDNCMMKVRA